MRRISVLLCAATCLGFGAPAHADTLVQHRLWACEEPYSGQLECGPPMLIPPGGYLWVGQDTKGPNIFTVYSGEGPDTRQVGGGGLEGSGVAGRMYTNTTDQAVLVRVFEHADAPEDRCGTVFESGFYESRQ